MEKSLEQLVMDRIDNPGWVSTRGILLDPTGESNPEQQREVEDVMKGLSEKGLVALWRLIIQDTEVEMLVAARPGFELDKDLEERGAWAKAVRYETEE